MCAVGLTQNSMGNRTGKKRSKRYGRPHPGQEATSNFNIVDEACWSVNLLGTDCSIGIAYDIDTAVPIGCSDTWMNGI